MTTKISHSEGHHENVRRSRWDDSFAALSQVTNRLGRLPRTPAEAEPRLLMWVTNQRRALNQPKHRQARLESLPGWTWNPRADQWEYRAEQFRNFLVVNGHTPRIRTRDPIERALAHWYSRQCVTHAEGRMTDERAYALAYAIRSVKP